MSNGISPQTEQNRESARDKSTGRFGSYESGESGATLNSGEAWEDGAETIDMVSVGDQQVVVEREGESFAVYTEDSRGFTRDSAS